MPEDLIDRKSTFGSGNDLVPSGSVVQDLQNHMASIGHSELNV